MAKIIVIAWIGLIRWCFTIDDLWRFPRNFCNKRVRLDKYGRPLWILALSGVTSCTKLEDKSKLSITQECYFIITLKGAQGRGGQSSFIASRGEGVFILKGGGHAVFRGNIEGSDVAREYQERTMEDWISINCQGKGYEKCYGSNDKSGKYYRDLIHRNPFPPNPKR